MILEEKYLSLIYFCNQGQVPPLIPVITIRDIETLISTIKEYKATVKMDFQNGLLNIQNFPWFSGNLPTKSRFNMFWKNSYLQAAWRGMVETFQEWRLQQTLIQKCLIYTWKRWLSQPPCIWTYRLMLHQCPLSLIQLKNYLSQSDNQCVWQNRPKARHKLYFQHQLMFIWEINLLFNDGKQIQKIK